MQGIFVELRRRNVFPVAEDYAVVGWLLAQAGAALTVDLPRCMARAGQSGV